MLKLILTKNDIVKKDLKLPFRHRFTPENEFISQMENFNTHMQHHDAYFVGIMRVFKAPFCGARIFQIITRINLRSKSIKYEIQIRAND